MCWSRGSSSCRGNPRWLRRNSRSDPIPSGRLRNEGIGQHGPPSTLPTHTQAAAHPPTRTSPLMTRETQPAKSRPGRPCPCADGTSGASRGAVDLDPGNCQRDLPASFSRGDRRRLPRAGPPPVDLHFRRLPTPVREPAAVLPQIEAATSAASKCYDDDREDGDLDRRGAPRVGPGVAGADLQGEVQRRGGDGQEGMLREEADAANVRGGQDDKRGHRRPLLLGRAGLGRRTLSWEADRVPGRLRDRRQDTELCGRLLPCWAGTGERQATLLLARPGMEQLASAGALRRRARALPGWLSCRCRRRDVRAAAVSCGRGARHGWRPL